jgi:hypothetical protein
MVNQNSAGVAHRDDADAREIDQLGGTVDFTATLNRTPFQAIRTELSTQCDATQGITASLANQCVDGLCYEAVMANDRAAVTASAILSIIETATCCNEALRAVAVYLRDEFADERRQTMADRGLADA